MRRADRLFMIVQQLRGGRLVTARQLAEKLEVSERTIYRDMADLIGSGVPVEGEAGVGYVLRAGYEMPPLMFTHAEAVALVAAARLLKAWGGAAMAEAAEEAIVKIDAVLPERQRDIARQTHIHALALGPMSEDLRGLIDRLDAAISARRRTVIGYADAEGALTRRTVRPMGLWFWGRTWTMVGWCELRCAFRMFRVDRIAGLEEGESFRMEPGRDLAALYREMAAHEERARCD